MKNFVKNMIKQKVMLQILEVATKFGGVPQSFCQNLNPV